MGWPRERTEQAGSFAPILTTPTSTGPTAEFRLGALERRLLLSGGDGSLGPSSPWSLNSLPGAAASLYLDFDGHSAGTWGSHDLPETPAYNTDGDTGSFSTGELANIIEIWKRVSEKFSPFSINVTTVRPASFDNGEALQVVIGGNGAWLGSAASGVAQLGSFSNRAANTVWVFEDNLRNGHPKYVAETVAHEAGHAFGLSHQSTYDAGGNVVQVYNPGDALRAPIAGNSYASTRGLWWHGTSESATTDQEDLSILAGDRNGFGYRPDDHGDSATAATLLTPVEGAVAASGVIHHMTDQDWFGFNTAGGTVRFAASVAEHGPMLDLKLGLHDALGDLIISVDTAELGEVLTATLEAGTYYVSVASHGAYGDVGQYTLSGTLPSGTIDRDSLRHAPRQLLITGTDAADTLTVGYDAGADVLIVNLNGQLTRYAAAGLTGIKIITGDGRDTIEIDAGVTLAAEVHAGAGDDYVVGGSGDDRLFGGEGNDTLVGGNGSDQFRGGAGHDLLNGLGGNDTLWGHAGNDTLLGGDGDDLLRGGEDNDVVKGEAGDDTLLGHDGDDDLLGQEGDDLIRGHGGMDRLFAGRGNDALDGGDGDDELEASLGKNVLMGGRGSDTFIGDERVSIFADYDTRNDWLAKMLSDVRGGETRRLRGESTGFFTASHPAYDRLLAAFDRDVRDVHGLRTEYGERPIFAAAPIC